MILPEFLVPSEINKDKKKSPRKSGDRERDDFLAEENVRGGS